LPRTNARRLVRVLRRVSFELSERARHRLRLRRPRRPALHCSVRSGSSARKSATEPPARPASAWSARPQPTPASIGRRRMRQNQAWAISSKRLANDKRREAESGSQA
jgi:hypothetical protein